MNWSRSLIANPLNTFDKPNVPFQELRMSIYINSSGKSGLDLMIPMSKWLVNVHLQLVANWCNRFIVLVSTLSDLVLIIAPSLWSEGVSSRILEVGPDPSTRDTPQFALVPQQIYNKTSDAICQALRVPSTDWIIGLLHSPSHWVSIQLSREFLEAIMNGERWAAVVLSEVEGCTGQAWYGFDCPVDNTIERALNVGQMLDALASFCMT